jgi:hypothetical protein
MIANRLEAKLLILGGSDPGNRRRRLLFHLRSRLRDCGVAHMADLALLFVGSVPVPVAGNLHGKAAHGKNQGHSQQSKDDSFRHSRIHLRFTLAIRRHHVRPIHTAPD